MSVSQTLITNREGERESLSMYVTISVLSSLRQAGKGKREIGHIFELNITSITHCIILQLLTKYFLLLKSKSIFVCLKLLICIEQIN